ncbi:MAG: sigma-70 family RNA polymerase sigma factor [Eubacteriales bacterium]|nr:sigma-70 family RNA polymerase sigma factor [Eubacteriales bacterium]
MDERIIALLAEEKQEGLALLQQRYGGMVRYIVRGILPDAQDAEECVSDVYLRVWQRFATFDAARGSLAAWLTAVARNTAVDYRRRAAAPAGEWDENAVSAPSPEDEVLRRERSRQLRDALERLSGAERQLFYRKYYYLQSTAQMAAELSLSERAVEGRLHRLRRRLRKLMGGDGA